MLPFANLVLFLPAALALALTPGPAVAYIVTRSVDQGRRAGLVSVLAMQLGNLVHVLGAALGVSAVLMASALAFDVVKYAGAAYLVYLGVRTLLARDVATEAAVEPLALRRVFTQGLLVGILNPKTALFFVAFLPQFADPTAGPLAPQLVALGLAFVLITCVTDSGYALAADRAGALLRASPRAVRARRLAAGTVYLGLGLATALTGTRRA